MHSEGLIAPTGALHLKVIRGDGSIEQPEPFIRVTRVPAYPLRPVKFRDILQHGLPQSGLPDHVNEWRLRNAPSLWRGAHRIALARAVARYTKTIPIYGQLWLDVIHVDGSVSPYGLASLRLVTTAGVNFIVDAFQNTTEVETLKYHGFGVGTNAEAVGDTALQTEETTQYVGDVRPTGSTIEGASANIYRTVGTYSPDSGTSPRPITEHGVFSASSAGTLLDRSVFSVVNLVTNADSLQATYDLTFPNGG